MATLAEFTLRDLIPPGLPDGRELVARGQVIAESITTQPSTFCRNRGFASELDYKLAMAQAGRTMTALTIGLQDWRSTLNGLRHIVSRCADRGFEVDRFILALDRRMGLPAEMRLAAIKETGPLLLEGEWSEVAQAVDIQPHMGDMMIGSPASVDNTCRALAAGVNYIGNLSQFAWRYPGWPGSDAEQMAEVVTALGVMAGKRHDGAVVHSYLDDGFPAQFTDYASYVGWAMLERHIVEGLIGAQLGHAYGGLSHNGATKMSVTIALESLRPASVCSSFYYTNTTHYSTDTTRNFGVLTLDALHLMLVDRRLRAGAAIMPVPVTEAVRVPSPDEIVDVQTVARDVASRIDDVYPLVNWADCDAQAESLQQLGSKFFDNVMSGLDHIGIDLADPLQLLLAVRRMGARTIEQLFGVGTPSDDPALDGYQPVLPTDTLRDFLDERSRVRSRVRPEGWRLTESHSVIVGSSDVHEMGLRVVVDAVEQLGIKAVVAGVGVDPEELADLAVEREATALLVSTHNGMALAYAEALMTALSQRNARPQVIFGGRLNQDRPGNEMPVDVTVELQALGIDTCTDAAELAAIIKRP
jgi:methylmalonyl-CoA mutase cobalamin-binding subunit